MHFIACTAKYNKLIRVDILNVYSLLHVYYTSVKLFLKKETEREPA